MALETLRDYEMAHRMTESILVGICQGFEIDSEPLVLSMNLAKRFVLASESRKCNPEDWPFLYEGGNLPKGLFSSADYQTLATARHRLTLIRGKMSVPGFIDEAFVEMLGKFGVSPSVVAHLSPGSTEDERRNTLKRIVERLALQDSDQKTVLDKIVACGDYFSEERTFDDGSEKIICGFSLDISVLKVACEWFDLKGPQYKSAIKEVRKKFAKARLPLNVATRGKFCELYFTG